MLALEFRDQNFMITNSDALTYIAHVAQDDKFVDMGYRQFEAVAPGRNRLLVPSKSRALQFVKSKAVEFCSLRQLKERFQDKRCVAIIFHSLNDATLLKLTPARNKTVVWIGWGYDYYANLLSNAYPDGLLLPKTKSLLIERPIVRQSLLSIGKRIVKPALGLSLRSKARLLKRVDIFSPVIELEYQMIRKFNPWFKAKYIPWNYEMDDEVLAGSGLRTEAPAENILVGNSASYENNHLEVFDILERHVNLADRKIIVPLSYGGDDWYKDEIVSMGKRKFGAQFVPLTAFLSIGEYVGVLQSCGHVFMNHLRQQGGTNIAISMLRGAKVYMNSPNPLYGWLEAKGCSIASIDAMYLATGKKNLTPLSKPDQQKNIDIINACWGHHTLRENTQRLVQFLLKEPPGIFK
jgi:dTDP-N-acetylfucosamine:lipid II N-acetylfucosaminyltransferase